MKQEDRKILLKTNLCIHPVSERPDESGEYIAFSVSGSLSGSITEYSKKYDRWNASDECGCNHCYTIWAWAEITPRLRELMKQEHEESL